MSQPFPDHYKEIADGMGISLYQKFSLNEASLFLRCPSDQLETWSENGQIECIMLIASEVQFFGYQLVSYLMSRTPPSSSIKPPSYNQDRIIRAKEVLQMVGLSRVTIWRYEKTGDFPQRVPLGECSVGWKLSEIQAWINAK